MSSAGVFCQFLESAGETQSSFARWLSANGDTRPARTILRSIQRLASGAVQLSGEMRVIMHLYQQLKPAIALTSAIVSRVEEEG